MPLTSPVLLRISLRHQPNAADRFWERFAFTLLVIGDHKESESHLMHFNTWLGDAAQVWRRHAFGSMLNTALVNIILLAAELCFWYQLSHVQPEWAEMPFEQDDSQANRTGINSTGAETQLELPAGHLLFPQTQNASRYPPNSWAVLHPLQIFRVSGGGDVSPVSPSPGDATGIQNLSTITLHCCTNILYECT